jgi:hypothetical protein
VGCRGAASSVALERVEDIVRQGGVEIVRDLHLPLEIAELPRPAGLSERDVC